VIFMRWFWRRQPPFGEGSSWGSSWGFPPFLLQEPLDEHLVHPLALPIHAYGNPHAFDSSRPSYCADQQ